MITFNDFSHTPQNPIPWDFKPLTPWFSDSLDELKDSAYSCTRSYGLVQLRNTAESAKEKVYGVKSTETGHKDPRVHAGHT